MTVEYIPAMGTQFMMMWKASKHNFKGTNLSWWKEDDLIKYPFVLTSAYYGLEWFSKKGIHFRDFMEIPETTKVMGDSGGFQELTMDAGISPLESLRWQERNVDVIMNLDYPILNESFDICLEKSVRNFELFEYQRKTDKPMYNVIHGSNYDECKKWYDAVKHFSFEYVALGFKPPNTDKLTDIFINLQKLKAFNQFKGIHFFGTSSLSTVPMIHYINHYIFHNSKLLTYDSSSYSNTMGLRDYIIPGLRNQTLDFGRKYDGVPLIPCDCPICKDHTVEDFNSFDSSGQLLISLHNLNEYIRYDKICSALVYSKPLLLKYVKNISEVAYQDLKAGIDKLERNDRGQCRLW